MNKYHNYKSQALALAVTVTLFTGANAFADSSKYQFDISRQSLAEALVEFSNKTNMAVLYGDGVQADEIMSSIAGEYSPEEALRKMLEGTGLHFKQVEENVFLVVGLGDEEATGSAGEMSAGEASGKIFVREGKSVIDEVVVTATKRQESLQDVPISVTAIDASSLDRAGAISIGDLEATAPSLNFAVASSAQSGIGIRGVADSSRNIGNEARVGVYVDGVYMGRSYIADQDLLLDVRQVEVLNGPQGTLWGKNTVSGAINITTQQPGEELTGQLVADLGSLEYRQFSGILSGPLVEDALLGSVSIKDTSRDGYINNVVTGRDVNNLNRKAGRGRLLYLPGDNLTVNLSFDYAEEGVLRIPGQSVDPSDFGGFAAAPGEFEIAHDSDFMQERQAKGAALTIEYDLTNDYSLTSISAYRESEFSTQGWDEDASPLDFLITSFDEKSSHFTQEIRLASPKFEDYDYLVGLFYMSQDLKTARFGEFGVDFGGPLRTAIPGDSGTESLALFLNGNYHINQELVLTFGFRVDHEKKEIDQNIIDETGLFFNGGIRAERADTNFSPRLGINYFMGDNSMFYASVSRAYKSGGWNADFITTFDQWGFDTENVTSYEVGVKSTYLDQRLRLNVAGYYMDFKDFQVFQFVPIGATTILALTNAGEVVSQGLEVNLDILINDYLTVTANAAYTDATFDSFKDAGGIGVDYDGNDLPFAPKEKAYIAVEYSKYVNENMEFVVNLAYSYIGEQFGVPSNTVETRIDSYGLLDARMGFIAGGNQSWEVWLWGKNLVDEIYEEFREPAFLGFDRAYYGLPRTYGVKINYKF